MKKNDKSKNEGSFIQPLHKKSNELKDNLIEMLNQIEKENSIEITESILDVKDVFAKRRKKKEYRLNKSLKKSSSYNEETLKLGNKDFKKLIPLEGKGPGNRPTPR